AGPRIESDGEVIDAGRSTAAGDRHEAVAEQKVDSAVLFRRAAVEQHARAKEFLVEPPRLVEVFYPERDVVDDSSAEERIFRRRRARKVPLGQRRLLLISAGGQRASH